MNSISPKICKIPQGTTLEELAEYLSLTPEQMKRYHNIYCPLDDLIGYDIPKHVTRVYVPPLDEVSRLQLFNPNSEDFIKFRNKNTLDRSRSFKKRYGIIYKSFLNGSEVLKMHYEIEVNKQSNKILMKRYKVFINNQRPDFIIEEIADKAGEVLYPLELDINEDGTIKAVSNQQEIYNNWLKLKSEFDGYYKGVEAENILRITGKNIRSKSIFLNKIRDNYFNILYFFPLYNTFNEDKEYTFQTEFPLDENALRLPFEITLSLYENISKTKKFKIHARGNLINPNQSLYNVGNSIQTQEGHFDFRYKLNSKDNSIFSIQGEISLKSSKLDKKITFECYEQL